jgi:hypothetical protein
LLSIKNFSQSYAEFFRRVTLSFPKVLRAGIKIKSFSQSSAELLAEFRRVLKAYCRNVKSKISRRVTQGFSPELG